MKANIFKISSQYNIIGLFEYIPLEIAMKIVLYNKRISKLLKFDFGLLLDLQKIQRIINPTYENITKYISYTKKDIKSKFNNKILLEESLILKAINSLNKKINIELKEKNWQILIKNLVNNRLELNPTVIDSLYIMYKNKKNDTLDYLRKFKNNIREIYFNSFEEKNEISFEMRDKIKSILNFIFKTDKRNNNINRISFENNSIMSFFDINNIFIEIYDILEDNKKYFGIDNIYINSKTIKNNLLNIKTFIDKKMLNIRKLTLSDFIFLNNDNSYVLSNLIKKLKYLNSLDLSDSLCDDSDMNLFFNNEVCVELKILKIKILYNDKMLNWKFLNNFINYLEILEIEIDFPFNMPSLVSSATHFNYKYLNIQELFSIINKISKLKKLKLIGDYLNSYKLNFFHNTNVLNFVYSFFIVNPEINNKFYGKSLKNIFLDFNKMKEITLIYNNYQKINQLYTEYDGIDLLSDANKQNSYNLTIFEFPPNLSVLILKDFTDHNFFDFFLIPLLKLNREKLYKIKEFKLSNCSINIKQFEEFLSILCLMNNLQVLSINNILFFDKFKMKLLINYIPTIFKNCPNLIELDISDNNYKEKNFLNKNFLNISNNLPNNLINFRIFNNKISISNKTLKILRNHFGNILDYENVSITD